MTTLTCPECGIEFNAPEITKSGHKRRFCSFQCKKKYTNREYYYRRSGRIKLSKKIHQLAKWVNPNSR